jgi:hypothetical protein
MAMLNNQRVFTKARMQGCPSAIKRGWKILDRRIKLGTSSNYGADYQRVNPMKYPIENPSSLCIIIMHSSPLFTTINDYFHMKIY